MTQTSFLITLISSSVNRQGFEHVDGRLSTRDPEPNETSRRAFPKRCATLFVQYCGALRTAVFFPLVVFLFFSLLFLLPPHLCLLSTEAYCKAVTVIPRRLPTKT